MNYELHLAPLGDKEGADFSQGSAAPDPAIEPPLRIYAHASYSQDLQNTS